MKKLFILNVHIAFTLAEVLITLGIIGLVAAMTIPTLMQNMTSQATVVAVKKNYSILSQAYARAVQENGPVSTWGIDAVSQVNSSKALFDKLSPYLNITKKCTDADTGCFPDEQYTSLYSDLDYWDFNPYTTGYTAQLKDGTLLAFDGFDSGQGPDDRKYGTIEVDVNGFKGPNQFGIDTFMFVVFNRRGIVPYGAQSVPLSVYYWTTDFDIDCSDKTSSSAGGYACTAWVITNQNLDYLKCPGVLSWNGPTKCP